MANGESRTVGSWEVAGRAPVEAPGPRPPLAAYRAALERYEPARLRAVQAALGFHESAGRPAALAGQVAEHLANPRTVEAVLGRLDHGSRLALGLFALTESASWPWAGLALALECLGVDPASATRGLVDLGMLAVAAEPSGLGERPTAVDPVAMLERPSAGLALVAHPAALSASRTVLPAGDPPATSGPVRLVREADGLEAVLRLAALWQRVSELPLRQTQQGTLYKRDRERIEDDPALAGPMADALEPLPDMSALWLALARAAIGLVAPDPVGDRAVAARPEFWAEHAVHLPQMIASRWLGLRQWHEQGGMQQEGVNTELALPYLRPVLLLWLATLGPDDWVAIDDLSAHLGRLSARWDRVTLEDAPLVPDPATVAPTATTGARQRPSRRGKPEPGAGKEPGAFPTPAGMETGTLEAMLLGAAYQLGLVRVAEEASGGRRVVQISPLGRYVLALGPPPPPRPSFEHFLFVQPNFEIIAYRQGLTPALIGAFSRFAQWSQIGAALALKLTAESVYRGLEGGLTEQSILDRLARHSPRTLPAGVSEALRTWSDRRQRVTYHAAATLIEFATPEDLEQGLQLWPAEGPPPLRISERLVLVEGDDRAIPYGRFRIAGSRSYRSDPEACIDVEPDGITLTLDLARSDLLVDAELARFADEQAAAPLRGEPGNPRRRFVVTPATLARAVENGLSLGPLTHWYKKRTGADIPPAVRLLLLANEPPGPLPARRPMVLQAPSSQWIDGLLQHPATRDLLGERLGPTAVVIPDESLATFRRALEGLGLALEIEPTR